VRSRTPCSNGIDGKVNVLTVDASADPTEPHTTIIPIITHTHFPTMRLMEITIPPIGILITKEGAFPSL
jgi:hypothetical protein